MSEYTNSTHIQENYVFLILLFFAPKSIKTDRERVEINEEILKITIS